MNMMVLKLPSALLLLVLMAATVGGPQEAPKPTSKPTATPVHHNAQHRVMVDFYLDNESMMKYPRTAFAVSKGFEAWAKALPIIVRTFSSKDFAVAPPAAIKIKIVGVKDAWSPTLLGWWDNKKSVLYLVGDRLEQDAAKALHVAIHEIGHSFGLPHFAEPEELHYLTAGGVVVDNAQDYAMYPFATPRNLKSIIQPLEIEMAMHYIKHGLFAKVAGHQECDGFHESH